MSGLDEANTVFQVANPPLKITCFFLHEQILFGYIRNTLLKFKLVGQ